MLRAHDHSHAQLSYTQQDSALTLAEGLKEYYAANAGRVVCPQDLPPESFALFRCHDMCHVIFGLDTTLDDEALADIRTMFSCEVGVWRYAQYLMHDRQAKILFKEIGIPRSIWVTVLAVPRIFRSAKQAWQMKKRWPWVPPDSYQNRSLADLRREFGIRVI